MFGDWTQSRILTKNFSHQTQSNFDWVWLGSVVEVGIHSIKNGMLYRKIACFADCFLFVGCPTTKHVPGVVVVDQCTV